MRCYYDLHIHTALSPCGDQDMTPNNIVNMALLKELDVIAITDHNSCQNAAATMKAAEGTQLLVIPGMEIETREEIHILCLFPTIEKAKQMQEIVYDNLPPLKNKPESFGHQYIINEQDEIIEESERLLLTATRLSLKEVFGEVAKFQGVAIPAHIDRTTYSIIANLGWIPDDLGIRTIEVSSRQKVSDQRSKYQKYQVIQSSDAHYLRDIAEKNNYMELGHKTIKDVMNAMNLQ